MGDIKEKLFSMNISKIQKCKIQVYKHCPKHFKSFFFLFFTKTEADRQDYCKYIYILEIRRAFTFTAAIALSLQMCTLRNSVSVFLIISHNKSYLHAIKIKGKILINWKGKFATEKT